MKKILIFGISGLTGYKIGKLALKNYIVFGTYNKKKFELEDATTFKFDIINSSVEDLIKKINPDIIINATALHNVDYCELNSNEAFIVNSKFLHELNILSKNYNFKIIHISTDYVFDGKKNKPYNETDVPKPLSVYGKSKMSGEKILLTNGHTIIRTGVVYGWTPLEISGLTSSSGKPMNFALWVLTQLHKNEKLNIVTDQFATATLADSLAESILKIIESDKTGLYHISGLSCESRYDFSIKLAKEFGYDPTKISQTNSSKFKQKAKRPAYSCLDSTKSINDLSLELLDTENALKIMKEQVANEAPHLLGDF